MKLSVSTLGCPEWNLSEILSNCKRYGYDGIELRGIQGHLDLTNSPLFESPEAIKRTRAGFKDAGLSISAIDTSAMLASAKHVDKSRTEAVAAIDMAAALDAPFIRVFGGDATNGESQAIATERLVEELARLGRYASDANVAVLLETHDAYGTGAQVAEVLAQVRHNSVGALWDIYNSAAIGEDPAASLSHLAPYLQFVHVKDGRYSTSQYCLLGDGDAPIRECVSMLIAHGYDGDISVEWEKKWHPDIHDPQIAFPQYADVLRQYVDRARTGNASRELVGSAVSPVTL